MPVSNKMCGGGVSHSEVLLGDDFCLQPLCAITMIQIPKTMIATVKSQKSVVCSKVVL